MAHPSTQTTGTRLLLLGATGLVGSHVLRQALVSPAINAIIAPTRKPLSLQSASGTTKLINPLISQNTSASGQEWVADAVICALGTTLKKAGSRDAFRQIDYDYPLAFARLARDRGATAFALTSAAGANPDSRFFYHRVKGELEHALMQEGFCSLTFVRPGVIGGARKEARPGEMALKITLTAFAPLLPRRWHLNPAAEIAARLMQAILQPQAGISIIPAAEMTNII
ncbi:NAD-dependent dehydratase (plasmid) [Pantoea agglomerans]|uniref:NAD-dependent dehydratase n=1 Tax=Enterobacter agglomerans TaxID=549 RepID=UPI0017844A73|nr:NAD-dependent dehydratase [Pantoea agglomerans]